MKRYDPFGCSGIYADAAKLERENAALKAEVDALRKLCGHLRNCVNLLHRLKRNGTASDAAAADNAIDAANNAIYESQNRLHRAAKGG